MSQISPSFRKHLSQHAGLVALLTFEDEFHVHKSHAPQQDQLLSFISAAADQEACLDPDDLATIRPFIWYEQSDSEEPDCINGVCDDQPIRVAFDVEVVSFNLEQTDAIATQFRAAICELNPPMLPGTSGPVSMGDILVQSCNIRTQTDDYEPTNAISADLGGYVRTYDLTIQPYWWPVPQGV